MVVLDNNFQYNLMDLEFGKFIKERDILDEQLIEDIYIIYLKYNTINLNIKKNKEKMLNELFYVLDIYNKENNKKTEIMTKNNIIRNKKIAIYILSVYLAKNITKKQFNNIVSKNNNIFNELRNKNYYGLTVEERIKKQEILNAYNFNTIISSKFDNNINLKKTIKEEIAKNNNKKDLIIKDKEIININVVNIDIFEQFGVKEVRFDAVLDLKTSKICQNLDGNIYNIGDSFIPIPIINTHSRCRSRLVPWDSRWENSGKRDNLNKKTIDYVKYNDWVKKFE